MEMSCYVCRTIGICIDWCAIVDTQLKEIHMGKNNRSLLDLGGNIPIAYLRKEAMTSPDTAEIIGICKGIIADKRVNQREAEALLKWVKKNQSSVDKWPCNAIFAQISEALSDHSLDLFEQEELYTFLSKICFDDDFDNRVKLSKDIPYDNPPPEITVSGSIFCLTGEFHNGKRNDCERIIEELGGTTKKYPVKNSILVVGSIANNSWRYGNFGNKVKQALKYREKGNGVVIISEDHLMGVLWTLIHQE